MRNDSARRLPTTFFPCMLVQPVSTCSAGKNFDMQVTAFWSQLIQRDANSPLFFLPLKLGRLGVGSAVQRHAAAPWRACQSVVPTNVAATQSPDTDNLFTSTPRLRAQLVQLQTTLSQQINEPAFLLEPLDSALRKSTTQKMKLVTSIQKRFHKQLLGSFTTSPGRSSHPPLPLCAAHWSSPHAIQQ